MSGSLVPITPYSMLLPAKMLHGSAMMDEMYCELVRLVMVLLFWTGEVMPDIPL